MKKAFILSTVLIGLVASSALARPTNQSLDHLHQRYAKLLVAKDFGGIERFYSDHISRDFKWKKANGPVMTFLDMWEGNRQDMANLANGVSDGPINFRMKLTSWKFRNNVATIEIQTNGNGEWYKDGGWTPVTFQMLVRETWRYENGKWIASAFQDIAVEGKFGKSQKKSSWRPTRVKS